MDFRFYLYILKIVLAVTLLSHCGLYVGDTYKNIPLSDTNLGCLDGLNQKFESYLNKEIPQEEIGQVAQCLQSALHIFKHHVWGQEVDTYEPEELRNFLQEFFLKEKKLSNQFLDSLMDLKVGLVGGSSKMLTSEELDQISERIGFLGNLVSDIYPYMDVLYNQKISSNEELKKSTLQLRSSLQELSQKLFTQPYSLDSALKFLEQSNEIFQFSEEQDFKWFKLFKNTAPFMLKNSKDVIEAYEWPRLLDMTMDIWSVYLHKIHGDQSDNFQDKIQHYSVALENGFTFLDKKVSSSPEKSLTIKELLNVAHSLNDDKVLPQGISVTHIERFLEHLFESIIEQPETQNFSLELSELKWWKAHYQSWKNTQNSIDALKVWLKNHPYYSIHDLFKNDRVVKKQSFHSSLKTINSLYQIKPLYSEGSLGYFDVHYTYPSARPQGFRYKNLTINNVYSSLVNIVMDRYAHQYPKRGLEEQEFGMLIKDYNTLSLLIRGQEPSIDPEKKYGRVEFVMSNILLYSTEGYYKPDYVLDERGKKVDLLSRKEGLELFPVYLHIKRGAGDLFQFLSQECSLIDLSCFKNNIVTYVHERMPYAPYFQDFIRELDQDSLNRYVDFLIQVIELGGPVQEIEKKQLEFVFYALVFQEVMITRFDQNEDDAVDYTEAMGKGFELWEGLIEYGINNVMCLSDQDVDLKFVYFYVISELDLMDKSSLVGVLNIGINYGSYFIKAEDFMRDIFGDGVHLTRLEAIKLAVNLAKRMVSKNILNVSCPQ